MKCHTCLVGLKDAGGDSSVHCNMFVLNSVSTQKIL